MGLWFMWLVPLGSLGGGWFGVVPPVGPVVIVFVSPVCSDASCFGEVGEVHPHANGLRHRPSFSTTGALAFHCEPQCHWASKNIRTARSHTTQPDTRTSLFCPNPDRRGCPLSTNPSDLRFSDDGTLHSTHD